MYWEKITKEEWDNGDPSKDIKIIETKNIEPRKEKKIYFDMDGVLANWNYEKSPEHPDGVTLEEVFTPGYFRKLPPIKENIELVKRLNKENKYEICILSKAIYTAIEEKYEWLQKYLPFIKKENIYFVPINGEKTEYVPHIEKYHILIDDYNYNLKNWTGTPIKAITDKNTINPLYKYIDIKNPIIKNIEIIDNIFNEQYLDLDKIEIDLEK